MEIAIIVGAEYVSSVGVTDDTPSFVNTPNRTFEKGEELEDQHIIYERSGNDFLAADYDVADEDGYTLNEILYKDNKLQYVSEITGSDVIKQPEEYTPIPPTTLQLGSWAHRYAHIGVLDTSKGVPIWLANIGIVRHQITIEGVDWVHRVSKSVTETYWGEAIYDPSYFSGMPPTLYIGTQATYSTVDGIDKQLVRYNNEQVYVLEGTSAPVAGNTSVLGTDGFTYLFSAIVATSEETTTYSVSRQETRTVNTTLSVRVVDMKTSCVMGEIENKAFGLNHINPADEWTAQTIIRRGDELYVRSDTDDIIQTKIVNDVGFNELSRLDQANGWGWTEVRPSSIYAPLDNKKYTYISESNDIEYTIKGVPSEENGVETSTGVFNSVAINGLIAYEVQVTFLPDDGSAAIPMITLHPQSNRDAR